MKKWNAYIILLLSIILGSCNMEDKLSSDKGDKEDITVRIILSMMDSRADSRASYTPPSESDYTLGSNNEYYINQYDVEVLVFDSEKKFVERASLVQAEATETQYIYELTGTLSNVVEDEEYQIVVLANKSGSAYCSNFPSSFTVGSTMEDVLEDLTYGNYTVDFTEYLLGKNNSMGRIPMWGVKNVTLKDGESITINMLRAMAKIRVNLEADGYTLSNVTLNNANPGGFFTPSMDKGITTAGITANVSEVRIPEGLTQLESLAFEKVDDSYIIYVPECYTFSEDSEGAKTAETYITVELKDNGGNEVDLEGNDKLYFREYRATDETAGIVNGSFFDIVRNYFYDYTITAVNTSSEELSLNIQYQVMGWTSVTNPNLTFGNDYGNVLEGESASPDPSNDNGTGTETGDASVTN